MSVSPDRLGEYVRCEAYLQIRGTDHDPNGHEATMSEYRDVIEDGLALWTDEDPGEEWIDNQAKTLYEDLYR